MAYRQEIFMRGPGTLLPGEEEKTADAALAIRQALPRSRCGCSAATCRDLPQRYAARRQNRRAPHEQGIFEGAAGIFRIISADPRALQARKMQRWRVVLGHPRAALYVGGQ